MSLKPLNLSDRTPEIANRLIQRYNIDPEPSDEQIYQSQLGTPIYSTLEFRRVSGTSKDNSQGVNGVNGGNDIMLRIDTALMVVTQTKNIVITPIQGQQVGLQGTTGRKRIYSTVKEYISGGDYMINIRGAIISPYSNVYPSDEVSLFTELMNLPTPLPIACNFLDLFSISDIVIDNFSVFEKMGSRNEVPFEINALSDEGVEFKLNNA